jgi:hypothetical protein
MRGFLATIGYQIRDDQLGIDAGSEPQPRVTVSFFYIFRLDAFLLLLYETPHFIGLNAAAVQSAHETIVDGAADSRNVYEQLQDRFLISASNARGRSDGVSFRQYG